MLQPRFGEVLRHGWKSEATIVQLLLARKFAFVILQCAEEDAGNGKLDVLDSASRSKPTSNLGTISASRMKRLTIFLKMPFPEDHGLL